MKQLRGIEGVSQRIEPMVFRSAAFHFEVEVQAVFVSNASCEIQIICTWVHLLT